MIFERLLHRNSIRRELGIRPINIKTAYQRKVNQLIEQRYQELLAPYLALAFSEIDWPTGFTPRLLLAVKTYRTARAKMFVETGVENPCRGNPDMQAVMDHYIPTTGSSNVAVIGLNLK